MNKKHWNTVLIGTGAPDAVVRTWTAESHELVAPALPKAVQAALARAFEN